MKALWIGLIAFAPIFAQANTTGRGDCDEVVKNTASAAVGGKEVEIASSKVKRFSVRKLLQRGSSENVLMKVSFTIGQSEMRGVAKVVGTPEGCYLNQLHIQ